MKLRSFFAAGAILTAVLSLCAGNVYAQDAGTTPQPPKMTPQMTEFYEPAVPVVKPASEKKPFAAPSDAIVLLGEGNDLSEWKHRNGDPVKWEVKKGVMTVTPSTGQIETVRQFGDCQLHIEWRSPSKVEGSGQGRGNSGIFLQGLYEVQVLDSYDNETYVNGMAASIYKQSAPLVNPIRKPGEWNTYDIIYTAPVFKDNGAMHTPGRITVIFNGVIVQNNTQISGTTEYIGFPQVKPHGRGPIILQDHGNPVSFRNIWIREL